MDKKGLNRFVSMKNLRGILSARICGPTVPIFVGVILLIAAIGFLLPIGFCGWLADRIKEIAHDWMGL